MGILYQLTFASGKKYIGVTEKSTLTQRISQHKYKVKNGSNLPVHQAWRKYGDPEILELYFIDNDALYIEEIKEIKKQNTICPNGYNILEGGQKSPSLNFNVAKKISESAKKRYQDPKQRKQASDLAKLRTEEVNKKISLALTGKKLSEKTKKKIRDINIGKKHTDETKLKMSKSHKGKKYSEETLERMRQSAKKRMQTPEGKAQLKSASLAGGEATKIKHTIK
jgi:hypothetical protein